MIEISQRARVRPATGRSRVGARVVPPQPRLDLMLAAARRWSAYGLWVVSGITRFDVPGDENYFVVRQGIAAAMGAVGLVVAALVPVDLVASVLEARLLRDARR